MASFDFLGNENADDDDDEDIDIVSDIDNGNDLIRRQVMAAIKNKDSKMVRLSVIHRP